MTSAPIISRRVALRLLGSTGWRRTHRRLCASAASHTTRGQTRGRANVGADRGRRRHPGPQARGRADIGSAAQERRHLARRVDG